MPSTASVPPRFMLRTIGGYRAETPSARKALDAAVQLAEGTIPNLILIGPTGVGKTHLAAGAVHRIIDRLEEGYRIAMSERLDRYPAPPTLPEWTNVANLIVRLRMEMGAPLDDRDATLRLRRLAKYPGLVVLDDLGRENTSDWTGETVYALVNGRYEAMLPTLVTSNLTASELAASPYWPVISRLAEDGALVEISAPDHRLRKVPA